MIGWRSHLLCHDAARPQTTDQTVKFHPVVEQHASAFVDKYAVVKNPRTLEFLNDLGKVELTLESEDGSVRDFAVSTVLVRSFVRGCASFGVSGFWPAAVDRHVLLFVTHSPMTRMDDDDDDDGVFVRQL